jgi:hypothetical protein
VYLDSGRGLDCARFPHDQECKGRGTVNVGLQDCIEQFSPSHTRPSTPIEA